MNYSFKSCRW